MRLKIASLILVLYISNVSTDKAGNAKPGFFVVLPPFFEYGTVENACISLHYIPLPTNATVTLKIRGNTYDSKFTFDSEYSCFPLQIPQLNETQPSDLVVDMRVQSGETVLKGNNTFPLTVSAPKASQIFLQTDRHTYKPGDVVKVRILLLNDDFLAGSEQKVSWIKLKNPKGITIAVWNDVKTEQGLAHLEYQLSDETVEGEWKIETEGGQKTIEIKKHVLPRFKVYLKLPESVYVDAKQLEFQVCAKYPFGQPVKGFSRIRVHKSYGYYHREDLFNITAGKELVNGCALYQFPSEKLNLTENSWLPFEIKANVTETGTGQNETADGSISVSTEQFQIEVERDQDFFHSEIPYHGLVRFKNVKDRIGNETLRICYSAETKDGWHFSFKTCSEFPIDFDKEIPFTIPPLKEEMKEFAVQISLQNTKRYVSGDYFYMRKVHSDTGNRFFLKQAKNDSLNCEAAQHFTIYYTANDLQQNLVFYYLIKSNNKIVDTGRISGQPENLETVEEESLQNIIGEKHNYTQFGAKIGSLNFTFNLKPAILWKYKILVYWILPNGDVIVEKKNVDLKPCLPNKVTTGWSHRKVRPGTGVNLNIKASPNSLCSVSAVDEATKYRSGGDSFDALKILERLIKDYQYSGYSSPYCNDKPNRTRRSTDIEATHDILLEFGSSLVTSYKLKNMLCIEHPPPRVYPESASYDGDDSFVENSPVRGHVLSHRVCKGCRSGLSGRKAVGVEGPGISGIVPVRSFFPETWLWDLIPLGNDGQAKLESNVPHTITNWVSDVLCVSPTEGVGLSNVSNLVTFQPFFVDVITPYSIKRGEILHLHVKVFNYLDQSLPVRVRLNQEDYLEVLEGVVESVVTCVPSSDNVDLLFKIRSKEIGRLNLTVSAETVAENVEGCGPKGVSYEGDSVQKTLLVEPEGFPVEVTNSAFMCNNVTQNVSWILRLPQSSNLVPDSAKSKVIVNSDIFGSTVENLGNLLTVPTGCGEQVMSKLAPNLYILRYLNSTNQLTDAIRETAVKYIKIGYEKILTYMHQDGSFSAFGERYSSTGSMFLTTFVVRTLTQAQQYIYIDNSVLNRSIEWIFQHQMANGCFPPLDHYFQRLADPGEPTLTAYVLVSLKKAGVAINETVVTKATSCILGSNATDEYTLALSSYALLLTNSPEATNRLKQIIKIQHKERFAKEYSPRKIETYAYTLLSLLQRNDENSLAEGTQLVHWLTSKMNPRGGFMSTQDTVVALDALSKYAARIGAKPKVQVHLKATDLEREIAISEKDALKLTTFNLKQPEDTVVVTVSGEGCVLAQSVVTYNVYSLTAAPAFNAIVRLDTSNGSSTCSRPTLHTCVSYNEQNKTSSMTVMEIGIPSGFYPDQQSLTRLVDQGVKRYEQDKNKVVLYFSGLTNEQLCTSFNIEEGEKIENRTAAAVNVFDYYEPENKASVLYNFEECK